MFAARALWITAPGRSELRREEVPLPGADEVLVRTRYSALSRGTERLVFEGRVPASEHARMRAPFQQGAFPFPVKYGYASVGCVEQGPAALRGRDVFCLHPHQSLYCVPASAVVPVPEGVPSARAVLAANMETALNAIWDADLGAGDRVCVVGAGLVGALCAYLAARHPGTDVRVVELDVRRAARVRALGARMHAPDDRGDYDVVLHASGAPSGLVRALELAGFEARTVELSWYGDRSVALPLGEAFHAKRLCLRSSQVGHIPPARAPRWTRRRRLELALALLADPALDGLFAEDVPFSGLPAQLADVLASEREAQCTRIAYPEELG